ncbi:EF-hand domain-containing family member B [Eufriesea mexicana]|uniref:EF-hand domain-containing family member B n=2 Tax=Eufriesea mexicana TaxID=516756 RepID=A0A310S786_9HYME|nr:EF-hand domain-containing family member B [Eufriesea mexicana]
MLPSDINNIHNIKQIIGVKECLQPYQETSFQTILSELKHTVMKSYWNKEVGKTRYQISNLPVRMNPLEVTFGKKLKSGETMAELLKEKIKKNDIPEQKLLEMYKKSHNSYLPAEQINRHYKKPFDQNLCFGKSWNASVEGVRLKKLLTWINTDSNTIVNSNLADFMKRSHPRIGEIKDLENIYMYTNMIHGKVGKKEIFEKLNILSDCPINNEVIVQQNYLKYINNLRQKLKKHVPEISFSDVYEDLLSFDKDYTSILSENQLFSILDKHKIHINQTFLIPLLDLLQIRKENGINYKELLKLLNWKYDFPTLPKIEKIPLECQYYNTTYNTTIGSINIINTTYIPTAGISYKNLDKPTAYSLILPNIFTRHGLSHTDLSKLRSKEEIKSIFEAIGIQFPNDSYNLLWEKGLEKNGTILISVETFASLLDQYDDLINDKNN